MTEWIWFNGEITPLAEARVSVEDRGFQFADGVYEVIRLYNGKPFGLDKHLARLKRSAGGIELGVPLETAALEREIHRLLARAAVPEGMIYLQLTRGAAARNHVFPKCGATLLFYVRALPPVAKPGTGEGAKLLAVADERWKRCWVKSIALLPNVLAKNQAIAAGADEAVFVENGLVSECAASNIFAVVGRKLVTHPVGTKVLPGITREILLELAPGAGLTVDERAIREEEAVRADELFITSTTREITWVARWNDRYIGQARCGPLTAKLHGALVERIKKETA
ncbi:MAG: aminotransferase class IV [Planctomycetota bacterium]|nr:aminotransferase class IV [Planctomycetota bacterium]